MAAEVCSIAKVPPYVLRSWEAEFPDLGVSKSPDAPRVYRRGDLEKVLRIRQLVYGEGLTLGAARRKLDGETPVQEAVQPLDELLGRDARDRLDDVKRGLQSILKMLSGNGDQMTGVASQPALFGSPAPLTAARPKAPLSRVTSTSTVGLPRESRISRA